MSSAARTSSAALTGEVTASLQSTMRMMTARNQREVRVRQDHRRNARASAAREGSLCLPAAPRVVAIAALVMACLAAPGLAQVVWDRLPGNVVLEPGVAGSADGIAAGDPAVVYRDGTYHMWYTASGDQMSQAIGYARSADGRIWNRYPGNPVMSDAVGAVWDGEGVSQPTVLYMWGQCHMWYTGYDGSAQRIGYATSPDGVAWTRQSSSPALALGPVGAWDGVGICDPTVVHDGTTYHLWYAGYDGQALRLGHATSSNGTTWSRDPANPVLDLGPSGTWDGVGVTAPSVVWDGRVFRMLYSGRGGTRASLGYASSRDGSAWTRLPDPVLAPGEAGGWDGAGLGGPSVLQEGSVYHLWYSGNDGARGAVGYASSRVPGDTDCDGVISAMDAVLVLQYVVRLINEFPIGELSLPKEVPQRPVYQVSLSEAWARTGERLAVQVSVDDAAGLMAGGIEVAYDPAVLRAIEAVPRPLLNGALWQTNAEYPGEVRCAFASAQPLDGRGELFSLVFEARGDDAVGETALELGEVTFNGSPAVTRSGAVVRFLPTAARLLGNYPNPFNPWTAIQYELPDDGPASLSVYNAGGQLVRALVSGPQRAGRHEVGWDGLDGSGRAAASGVYLCRLKAGTESRSRKLLLAR
ncbi:FlgD immunoglobulin-like domain containing protein [Candidatus Latescibacterota bacterium]